MVSLRLTEKDYQRLVKICETEDVRSLSALARIALHRLEDPPEDDEASSAKERLLAAEARLDALEALVNSLRRRRPKPTSS